MSPRLTARASPLVVLVLLSGALLACSLLILGHRATRRSGTNATTLAGFVIPVGAGQRLCEPGELVPADTASLELFADTKGEPAPALEASIAAADGGLFAGTRGRGWPPGRVRIPIKRVSATTGATVCVRNLGATAVAFGGSVPDAGFQSQVAGRTLDGRLRIEYLRPGRESWFELLPTIAHRFSLAKSGLVRSWAAIAVLVLMLLALALAITTTFMARTSR